MTTTTEDGGDSGDGTTTTTRRDEENNTTTLQPRSIQHDCYPLKCRVVLQGLTKAPDLNGQIGVVTSALTDGRQSVVLATTQRTVRLKPSTMKFAGRTIASLSVKELKKLVTLKTQDGGSGGSSRLSGMDKAELQTRVHDLLGATASSPDEIAELLATTATTSSTTPTKKKKKPRHPHQQHQQQQSLHQQQATEFGNMDPNQLRAQARMMRSMTPQQIRMTNPQLANMSDRYVCGVVVLLLLLLSL